MRTARRWLQASSALLLPLRCLGCSKSVSTAEHHDGVSLCSLCRMSIDPLPGPRCQRCDLPLGSGLERPTRCPHCAEWPEQLVAACSATALAGAAQRLVRALKYGGWAQLADFMAEQMATLPALTQATATASPAGVGLVPVPTLVSRRRRRGYNQAELIARGLSRRLGHRLCDGLERTGARASQVSLQAEERAANVEGSFRPGPDASSLAALSHIVLVDDVLTTGATLCEATRVLAELGVQTVIAVTFARTLHHELR